MPGWRKQKQQDPWGLLPTSLDEKQQASGSVRDPGPGDNVGSMREHTKSSSLTGESILTHMYTHTLTQFQGNNVGSNREYTITILVSSSGLTGMYTHTHTNPHIPIHTCTSAHTDPFWH